jgi:hypothetical protein
VSKVLRVSVFDEALVVDSFVESVAKQYLLVDVSQIVHSTSIHTLNLSFVCQGL